MAADWDLGSYFDGIDGADYRGFRAELEERIRDLVRELEALAELATAPADWAAFVSRLEEAHRRSAHLGSYLGCLSAADTRDEMVQGQIASHQVLGAEIAKLFVGVRAALARADDATFEGWLARTELEPVGHFLRRLRQRAAWSMPEDLEALAADLAPDGLSAWGRLYDRVAGRLEFDLSLADRESRRVPVSVTRSLLEDPAPDVRRAALQGANAAWASQGHVVAACLNAIAGTRLALYARRGVEDFLDPALFDASISRRTLDTLLEVVASRRDVARRYLRRKATLLGRERLGFQDLMAPLPLAEHAAIPWSDAEVRVLDAFGDRYPALRAFAEDALARRWVDHTPRAGKAPGGFCSTSTLIDESRVFLTYADTFGDLSTLAHELGHAFHGSVMRGMRHWARRYPMTLAETASTFAEQLLTDAVLDRDDAAPAERAVMLDRRLQDAAVFLLNIPMRFTFERRLYEERARGELSAERLGELMREAQLEWYGDALDPEQLDPWFWASKLHFYITSTSFYNFPYTFGYLFSLGLFVRAREEGPAFLPRYEALLQRTGSDGAENVARHALGIDLEAPGFWHASIDTIDRDFERFDLAAREVWPGV